MTGKNLKEEIKNVRNRLIRFAHGTPAAHLGSCLSSVEILCYLLFNLKENEEVIIDKGHIGLLYYSILIEKGLLTEKDFLSIEYKTHLTRDEKLGIKITTGSLGFGLSAACGMALANRNKRFFVLLSDGACDEGVIWETLSFASKENLNNLVIILDANGWKAYGKATHWKILRKRFESFGWKTITLSQNSRMNFSKQFSKPTIYIVKTKKGKGFIEDSVVSHNFKIEDYEKNIRQRSKK